jgi:hypothetical protein
MQRYSVLGEHVDVAVRPRDAERQGAGMGGSCSASSAIRPSRSIASWQSVCILRKRRLPPLLPMSILVSIPARLERR